MPRRHPAGHRREAAEVGRTTLYQYFSDHEALVAAAVADSVQAIDQAVADAAHDDGISREAMHRLLGEAGVVEDGLEQQCVDVDERGLE